MIVSRACPRLLQRRGCLLGMFTRRRIHNTGLVGGRYPLEKHAPLGALVLTLFDSQPDIGAIETVDRHVGITHVKPLADLFGNRWGRCCRQSKNRRASQRIGHGTQSQVVRAKIVSHSEMQCASSTTKRTGHAARRWSSVSSLLNCSGPTKTNGTLSSSTFFRNGHNAQYWPILTGARAGAETAHAWHNPCTHLQRTG